MSDLRSPTPELADTIYDTLRRATTAVNRANGQALVACLEWHWKGRERPPIEQVTEEARLVFYPTADEQPSISEAIFRYGLEGRKERWAYDWIIRHNIVTGITTTEGPRVAVHTSAR